MEKKPFLETIPGILTAIGGTIAAIAGLVTALYSAGMIGPSKAVATPSPSVTASTSPIGLESNREIIPTPTVTISPSPPSQSHAPSPSPTPDTPSPTPVKPLQEMAPDDVGFDRPHSDYREYTAAGLEDCRNTCLKEAKCKAFSFNVIDKTCWLKDSVPFRVPNQYFIAGVKIEE